MPQPYDPSRYPLSEEERLSAWDKRNRGVALNKGGPNRADVAAMTYSIGEPNYRRKMREQAVSQMSGMTPTKDVGFVSAGRSAYAGGLGDATYGGGNLGALRASAMESGLRDAEMGERVGQMGEGVEATMGAEDWNMRQRALMELLRRREWEKSTKESERALERSQRADTGKRNFAKGGLNIMGTLLGLPGLGSSIIQGE